MHHLHKAHFLENALARAAFKDPFKFAGFSTDEANISSSITFAPVMINANESLGNSVMSPESTTSQSFHQVGSQRFGVLPSTKSEDDVVPQDSIQKLKCMVSIFVASLLTFCFKRFPDGRGSVSGTALVDVTIDSIEKSTNDASREDNFILVF